MVRLRQLFQGQPADHDPAGADPQIEFRAARQLRGDADQPRPLRQARHRRHLRRHQRRGMGAAGRPRDPVRLHDVQRAAAAAVEDRPALRPGRQHRRDRPQLHAPGDVERRRLLRQDEVQLQSVHRLRRDRHVHRRVQRRQFRSRPARLRRRRLSRPGADQRPPDRDDAGAAGHAEMGRGVEEGGRATIISARSRAAASTAASTAIATSISISIRPTRIASAGR